MKSREELTHEVEVLGARIATLGAAVLRLGSSLELTTVLQEAVDSARVLTGARYSLIVTVDEAGEARDFFTSGLTPEEHRELAEWPDGPGMFAYLRDLPGPLRLDDLSGYFRTLGFSDELVRTRTLHGTPMRHRGVRVGNFFLAGKEDAPDFTDADDEMLELFASQAAAAIVNARAHQQERRARADLEALIETTPVGVMVIDARTGRPVSSNREALRLIEPLRAPDLPAGALPEDVTCRLRIPVIPISRSSLIPITSSTVSDHQSERSDAGVPLWGEVIGLVQRSMCLSHGFSCEVELVGVVDEPVEDGICEGGIADYGMPALHGQLRGHDRGAQSMAVLDDFEQVASVLGAEFRNPPIVDDQDGGLGDRGEQLGIAPVGARDGQLGQQPREAPIRGAVSIAACAVGEGARYPTLSHPGRSGDEAVEMLADPAPVGERQHEVTVEPAGLSEVDVLDARRMTQPGAPQPVGELARGALGEFSVDDEPEALLERQGLDLG